MSSRIVYPLFSAGGLQGGHKMILRHVETLRDLGFNAVAYTGIKNQIPTWFEHRAPILRGEGLDAARDVLMVPDDAYATLRQLPETAFRVMIMVQNQFNVAAAGLEVFDLYRDPVLLTVSPTCAGAMARLYPQATIRLVRAFADERVFRPAAERQDAVALSPRKRPIEAGAIHGFFTRAHPAHAGLPWRRLEMAPEREVAATFGGSTLCLSLSRLESLGMTPLEAMASGCVVAGFLGVGGRDSATGENGFWAPDEDCVAAADALAGAADLVRTGGPALAQVREAGFETARQWSYARFREELEAFWMEFAPAARIRSGPLD